MVHAERHTRRAILQLFEVSAHSAFYNTDSGAIRIPDVTQFLAGVRSLISSTDGSGDEKRENNEKAPVEDPTPKPRHQAKSELMLKRAITQKRRLWQTEKHPDVAKAYENLFK